MGKLTEAIHHLQARVTELMIQAVSSTPQEVRDQKEEDARSTVEIIRALYLDFNQLSDISAQIYEHLAEKYGAEEIGSTTPGGEATSRGSSS
jgi:hypothetical protein